MQLIQGDCLEEMKNIPDGTIDMVLADPPFGITACKWDSVIPLEAMWRELKRIIKSTGAIVLNSAQPFTTTLISSNMKMFKYCWYWNQCSAANFALAKYQPLKIIHDVVVFGIKRINYYPQMTDRNRIRRSTVSKSESIPVNSHGKEFLGYQEKKYPKNLIEFSNASHRDKKHPTQKPVALVEYMIKTYTDEGETVLDFCMGSGTTGVACKNLNREFIGIELDKEYFEKAKARI